MSLQTRLLIAVGLLAVAAVLAVAAAARQGTRQEFLRFRDVERRSLTMDGVQRAHLIAVRVGRRCCAPGVLDAAAEGLHPSLMVVVVDEASGQVIGLAGDLTSVLSRVTITREGHVVRVAAMRRKGLVVHAVELKLVEAGVPLTLLTGGAGRLYVLPFPSDELDDRAAAFLGSLDRRLIVATTGVALLALALTWMFARNTVRPIAELRAAARDLGAGDLSRRVQPAGADEVAELGRAFNTMAGELERQERMRRDLMHDVAHELRTPLTALRCRVETIVDGLAADPGQALADVRHEVLHLGRLVDDLQELALAEARALRLDVAPVSVAEVVASAVRAAGLDGDTRLHVDVAPDVVASADAGRVRQIVLNLLTNAGRYTPPDGSIALSAVRNEGTVRVEVRNTGSTLDTEALARIFDRFYRTDPSRQRDTGGAGLGLAIVRHLVEAQGGRVHASSDDTGVTVGFTIPSA
jgi:signal transduction histidine kinase